MRPPTGDGPAAAPAAGPKATLALSQAPRAWHLPPVGSSPSRGGQLLATPHKRATCAGTTCRCSLSSGGGDHSLRAWATPGVATWSCPSLGGGDRDPDPPPDSPPPAWEPQSQTRVTAGSVWGRASRTSHGPQSPRLASSRHRQLRGQSLGHEALPAFPPKIHGSHTWPASVSPLEMSKQVPGKQVPGGREGGRAPGALLGSLPQEP